MRKGLLYLLPIMALTQMGASVPDLRADHDSINNRIITDESRKDAPTVGDTEKSPRPIAGRNGAGHNRVFDVPRAGRNVTRIPGGRVLVPRN